MKDNLTELVVVLDRSGSMSVVRGDAIGGFNTFLEAQQKAPGEANITVVQFNTILEKYADGVDVRSIKPLTQDTYVPYGNTALYDAVGETIDKTGQRLASMKENDRPSKVIFAILTDGEENSSKEYSGAQVKKAIEHQREKYNWDFIFLAAGEGAFKEANAIGMDLNKTIRFANTGENQTKSYEVLANYASVSRSMSAADYMSFSSTVNLQSAMDGDASIDTTKVKKPDTTTSGNT